MENRMKPTAAIILSTLLLSTPFAWASDNRRVDDETATAIRAQLSAEGYEVRKIEREDGMIEVYAVKDGQRYELYLDADLTVQSVKTDD